jgi:putative PEP-CTERM system TPR-repeat lipoprotein
MLWAVTRLLARQWHSAAGALLIFIHIFATADAALADEEGESLAHYDKAAQYVEAGKLQAAVIELKNALQLAPANVEARLLLGNVYLRLSDGTSAENTLKAAERYGIDVDRIAAPLGRALLLQGRFTEVLSGFDPAGREPSIAFELSLLRGEAQTGLGQFSDARTTYEDLGKGNPADARISLGLARIDMAEGKFEAVESHAVAALALNPDLAEATFLRAEARREKGDPEGAVPLYRETIDGRSVPLVVKVQARLGLTAALIALGRDAQAEAELAALQSSAPDSPLAAYLAALIKVRAHDFAAARSVLEKSSQTLQEYAPAQFLFGIVYYAAGEFDTARSWLGRHLHADPENLLARKLLGATLMQLGDVPDALAVLGPALAQAPNDPQVLLLLGNANLRSGHAVEAVELLQRAVQFAPSDPRVLGQLAIGQVATGQDEEAMASLSTTLDLGADANLIGYALAYSHLRQGESEAALKVAQRLPDSALSASLKGAAYTALGRFYDARSAYETALKFDPDFLTARASLAALKALAGDVNGAETTYLQVLERDKTNVLALMGLAGIEHRRGNESASRAWFEKAAAANPQAVTPVIALAESYAVAGALPTAIELLKSLADSHRESSQVFVVLGRLQMAAGRSADAVDTYKRLVAASGGAADARLLLAQSQLAAGETEAARRGLENALAIHPEYAPTADALVQLVEASEGPEASLAYAEQLQRRFPDALWSDQLLGDLHWRAGRLKAASAAYEKAWARSPSAALAVALSEARMRSGTPQGKEATAILSPLREWLATHPADDTVRLALAKTQLALGELAASRESYELLTVSQANNPVVWNNLAWLYQQSGDARAAEYGERALALAPHQTEILDTLGWILLNGGQIERAASLLQQAHQAAPSDPDIAFHYAAALHRNGDDVGAKKVLQPPLKSGNAFATRADAEALLRELTP